MVIAFANQKGGVGKTTLCMLFANYLAKKGINVLVVDVDRQRSLMGQRKSDSDAWEDQEILYNVEEVNCEKEEETKQLMKLAKSIDGVVLIDTPGNVTENGLIPIFSQVDAIVCPYQYETRCLESTGVFVRVMLMLKEDYKEMNPSFFYLPNLVDSRVGTQSEKDSWNDADAILGQVGKVLPRIALKASVKRANTYFLSKEQEDDVAVSFDVLMSDLNLI